MVWVLVVTASAGLANAIKFGVGTLASLRVTTFAAEVIADPPSGFSEIASVASREGFTFVVAVLFLGALFTQRLKITDPKADSDLALIRADVSAIVKEVSVLTVKLEQLGEEAGRSRDSIESKVESVGSAVDRLGDRLNAWQPRRSTDPSG